MRGMGRVYKRGPVWWIYYCKRNHVFRESASTTDEAKARKFLSQRLKEREKPTFVAPNSAKSSRHTKPLSIQQVNMSATRSFIPTRLKSYFPFSSAA